MGIKSYLIYQFARRTQQRIAHQARHSVKAQEELFQKFLRQGSNTAFGKDHSFSSITSHQHYTRQVPVRDYEAMKPYIDRVTAGERNVLWPGVPLYFAKTSGTTSGVKYIPITRDSIPNHVNNARDALFNITSAHQLRNLFDGKMIFLSGSPALERKGQIPTGRLSGIINHWVPSWLRANQLPTFATNCIEDWETKVDHIAEETKDQNLTLISGIPPWVQMYFERLLDITGKETIADVFPDLQLFVYGGVNYEPYRAQLEKLMGKRIAGLETFPASEGFMAYQDQPDISEGLLLSCQEGIFFEFVPLSEIQDANPSRLTLKEVEKGIQYAVLLTTNAGLWSYNIGDTIEFLSVDPPRIKVTGRIKHFISAFGEHVIAKEVEEALMQTLSKHGGMIHEFTVAPQVQPPDGSKPYHEWWIEFGERPKDLRAFSGDLDEAMRKQNLYYDDLIRGKILQPLVVRIVHPGGFKSYMHSVGKLGGQNKVPRLSNDRGLVSVLERQPHPTDPALKP